MKHDEFIGQVQARARLGSRGDAERVTRATLETLGERLAGGEAKDLASQLPREIGRHLLTYHSEKGKRMTLDEFFEKVSEREEEDLPKAVFHARAVISVLQEAVTPGELEDVRSQLGPEFEPLFESGAEGELRRDRD